MNVLSISNIFQHKSPNNSNNSELQNSLNKVLNTVENHVMNQNQKDSDREFQANLDKIDKDVYINESDNLDEADSKILEYYLGLLKLYSSFTSKHEDDLNDFKEQLMYYDKNIDEYQKIIDGEKDIPDGGSIEDYKKQLNETQQAREKYLKEGCDKLNSWDLYSDDSFDRSICKAFGENKYANKKDSYWKIDSSASDIYAEIERVTNATKELKHTINKGIRRIYDVLEKNGYGTDKYDYYHYLSKPAKQPITEVEMLRNSLRNNKGITTILKNNEEKFSIIKEEDEIQIEN